jgi:hypothetical protein
MSGAKDRPRNVLDAMAHFHHAAPVVAGDGATTEFALPVTVLRGGDLMVFINGVLQHEAEPGSSYDYALRGITAGYAGDSNRVKFTAAPALGAKIKLIAAGG